MLCVQCVTAYMPTVWEQHQAMKTTQYRLYVMLMQHYVAVMQRVMQQFEKQVSYYTAEHVPNPKSQANCRIRLPKLPN
jgi:hypothetical protein